MKYQIVLATVAALFLGTAQGVVAQDTTSTLADIRQQAAVLSVEIANLKRELSTTGAPNTGFAGGSTLERVDLMEAALSKMTGKIEQLEFRIDSVVRDGTNQLDDLNFRLCELETGCDIGNLPPLKPIGGETVGTTDVISGPGSDAPMEGGGFALTEQGDFDAAMAQFDAGDYVQAANSFDVFAKTYTGGFLTGEAHFMRGEALLASGATKEAARAYLDSFSGSPEGDRAPSALLRLGTSLISLGQIDQGCVMLGEVNVRFAGAAEVAEADAARRATGCQ